MSAVAMTTGWRLEVTEEMRKAMITQMYHELLRITGETDREKVWRSVAKFELTLWTQSMNQETYLAKLQRKIDVLVRKQPTGRAATPNSTTANAVNAMLTPQERNLLQQQYQQQKQVLAVAQHGEMIRLRLQQLMEQNQIASTFHQQNIQIEERVSQMTILQQSHLTAREELARRHSFTQLQLKQEYEARYLSQSAVLAGDASNEASGTPSIPPLTSSAPSSLNATPAPTIANPSYGEKLMLLKAKYWDDLVILSREFTRMASQPSDGSQLAAIRQERVNTFLQILEHIMALLSQDPSRIDGTDINNLDRLELHIEQQMMPILRRLQNGSAASAVAGMAVNGGANPTAPDLVRDHQTQQTVAATAAQSQVVQAPQAKATKAVRAAAAA